MRITRLRIEGFRCFNAPIELNVNSGVNLLVGPNNVGKTSLMTALRRLTRMDEKFVPLVPVPDGQGGMGGLHFAVFQTADLREATDVNIHFDIVSKETTEAISAVLTGLNEHNQREDPQLQLLPFEVTKENGSNAMDFACNREWIIERVLNANTDEESFNPELHKLTITALTLLAAHLVYIPPLRSAGHLEVAVDLTKHEERRYDGETLLRDLLNRYLPNSDDGVPPNASNDAVSSAVSEIIGEKIRIWPTLDNGIRVQINNDRPQALSQMGAGIAHIVVIAAALQSTAPHRPILLLDEPENSLHPTLQKRLMHYLANSGIQSFVATHSNHIIDLAPKDAAQVAIHQLYIDDKGERALTTLDGNVINALADLGVSASSIASAPAVVWVEGPSDAIYLRLWLERLSKNPPQEGIDFTFAFHGGSLLAHHGVDDNAAVQVHRAHPGFYLVADSDRKETDGALGHAYLEHWLSDTNGASRTWVTAPKEVEGYVHDHHLVDGAAATREPSQPFLPLRERLVAIGGKAYLADKKVDLAHAAVARMRTATVEELRCFDLQKQIDHLAAFIHQCRERLPRLV